MGSVLADVQSPLQILNVLLICGSEDVNGTTDVAGMTPYSVLCNPRAADNGLVLTAMPKPACEDRCGEAVSWRRDASLGIESARAAKGRKLHFVETLCSLSELL